MSTETEQALCRVQELIDAYNNGDDSRPAVAVLDDIETAIRPALIPAVREWVHQDCWISLSSAELGHHFAHASSPLSGELICAAHNAIVRAQQQDTKRLDWLNNDKGSICRNAVDMNWAFRTGGDGSKDNPWKWSEFKYDVRAAIDAAMSQANKKGRMK